MWWSIWGLAELQLMGWWPHFLVVLLSSVVDALGYDLSLWSWRWVAVKSDVGTTATFLRVEPDLTCGQAVCPCALDESVSLLLVVSYWRRHDLGHKYWIRPNLVRCVSGSMISWQHWRLCFSRTQHRWILCNLKQNISWILFRLNHYHCWLLLIQHK